MVRGPLDLDAHERDLAGALAAQGLSEPEITLQVVPALERHKETGKLKRFIPLPPNS